MKTEDPGVSWWDYAAAYDLQCEINYHYDELLSHFQNWLQGEYLTTGGIDDPTVCDLGAGTGNFILKLAEAVPQAKITHWDWNSEMIDRAKAKYSERCLDVEIVAKDVSEFENDNRKFDLIVMINALYSFPNPEELIATCVNKLNEHGFLYVVDTGRPIDPMGWTIDLTLNAAKNSGIFNAIKTTWQLRNAIQQNKKIEAQGDAGVYWRHNLEDLVNLVESHGLQVSTKNVCYRGIADRVIATKS